MLLWGKYEVVHSIFHFAIDAELYEQHTQIMADNLLPADYTITPYCNFCSNYGSLAGPKVCFVLGLFKVL